MFLLRWCDGARSLPHPSFVVSSAVNSKLLGRIGVPAVGKTTELDRVTLLRCEFDELVGRGGITAAGKVPQLIHVTPPGSELDQLVGRLLVAVFGPLTQVGQIGFSHDDNLPVVWRPGMFSSDVSARNLPGLDSVPDARSCLLCAAGPPAAQ